METMSHLALPVLLFSAGDRVSLEAFVVSARFALYSSCKTFFPRVAGEIFNFTGVGVCFGSISIA